MGKFLQKHLQKGAQHSLLILMAVWCWAIAPAMGQVQQYPVQANLTVTPPYSLHLSDYVTAGSDKLSLMVWLKDLDKPEVGIRFRLTVEGAGVLIRTSPSYLPNPRYVQGGMPEYFTGSDLAGYFNPAHLDFVRGISRQAYQQSGRLPEGVYRICLEVIDAQRGKTISNAGCITAWMMLNDPPMLNLPLDNSRPVATVPQQVNFQWTPMHTASPNSAFTTEYLFQLYEVWPVDRNPEDIVRSAQPVFETTTQASGFSYGMAESPLIPGRRYVWRVKAYDLEGRDLFNNDGYSQPFVFQYGEVCLPPEGLSVDFPNVESMEISWETGDGHTQFALEYREKGGGYTFDENTYINKFLIRDLEPGKTYEYRIKGFCGSLNSEFSAWQEITLPEMTEEEFACGTEVAMAALDRTNLKDGLVAGDVIMAGDFDVKVVKVEGRRTFTGQGLIVIPMMNHMKVAVDFENIQVNEDMRLVDGLMRVTKATFQVLDDATIAQVNDILEEVNTAFNNTSEVLNSVDEIIETVDAITGGGGDEWMDDPRYEDMTPEELVQEGMTLIAEAEEALSGDITSNEALEIMQQGAQLVKAGISMGADANQAIQNSLREATEMADAFVLNFLAVNDQKYGLDRQTQSAVSHKYEQFVVAEESYPIPWKSVAVGQQDHVLVEMLPGADSLSIDELSFSSDYGAVTLQDFSGGQRKMTVQGRAHEEVESIYATFEQEVSADSEEGGTSETRTDTYTMGKLNVISYNSEEKQVVLVPVGDVGGSLNAYAIQTKLNAIYQQAVVNWQLTVADKLEVSWDIDGDGKMNDGESGMFTSYTDEMKEIIRAMEDRGISDDVCYLFLVPEAKGGASKNGFMPRKNQFGFLYAPAYAGGERKLVRTLAHELGHGAFRLEHTFKDFPAMAQGTTQNLMDYADGTRLYKYQWDYIHDPVAMVGWAQDEDDAEYLEESNNQQIARLINHIKCGVASGASKVRTYHTGKKTEGRTEYTIQGDLMGQLGQVIVNLDFGGSSAISDEVYKTRLFVDFSESAGLAYEDVTLNLSDIKTDNYELRIASDGGYMRFFFPYAGETKQQAFEWLMRATGLDGSNSYGAFSVDNSKDWQLEQLVMFSKCEYEQFNRENREHFFTQLNDRIENWVGLDRDTYQQMIINLLNTVPTQDEQHFYQFFKDRPDILYNWYDNLDGRIRDQFLNGMLALWIKSSDNSKSNVLSTCVITNSIFGHANNMVDLTPQGEVKFWDVKTTYNPYDTREGSDGIYQDYYVSFRAAPFEPVYVGFEGEVLNEDKMVILPAIFIKSFVDKGNMENLKDAGWLAFNTALIFTGVGEVVVAVNGARAAVATSGIASRQFASHALKASIGTADVLASISTEYCNLPANSAQEFCVEWKKYEDYVTMGFLTISGIDLLKDGMNKAYAKMKEDPEVTIPDEDVHFFEEVLGLSANLNIPYYSHINNVPDVSKYSFNSLDARYEIVELTASFEGEYITVRLNDGVAKTANALYTSSGEFAEVMKLVDHNVELFYKVCKTSSEQAVDITKIDDQIKGLQDLGDEIGKTTEDAVNKYVGGACFTAGTPVAVAVGTKAIEQIQMGDSVWAFNTETQKEELARVVQLYQKKADKLYHIVLDEDTLSATPEHPFYVDGKWVKAEDLQSGQYLFRFGQIREKIRSISIQDTAVNVYNFTVQRLSNYYVGRSRVLVHNNCSVNVEAIEAALETVERGDELRKLIWETEGWLTEFSSKPLLVASWDAMNVPAIDESVVNNLTNIKVVDNYLTETGTGVNSFKEALNNAASKQEFIDELGVVSQKGTRIPKTKGSWVGEPGESAWKSDKEVVNAVTNHEAIPFKNAYPDFTKWAYEAYYVEGLTGVNTTDFAKVYKKMVDDPDLTFATQEEVKQWLRENKITLHHHQDGKTIQLIPSELHNNIPHSGGASILRKN